MSNLNEVKRYLTEDLNTSAEYLVKTLGVSKPYAHGLLSKARKELDIYRTKGGAWRYKAPLQNPIENPQIVAVTRAEESALDVQVGGGHYKGMKIQPVKFITENNLDFLTGCIIKRICRWKDKDGLKDLEKIKHEVDLIIELNGLK